MQAVRLPDFTSNEMEMKLSPPSRRYVDKKMRIPLSEYLKQGRFSI